MKRFFTNRSLCIMVIIYGWTQLWWSWELYSVEETSRAIQQMCWEQPHNLHLIYKHKSHTSGAGLSSGYKRQYHRPPAMHSAAQALEMGRRSVPEDAKMGCGGDNASDCRSKCVIWGWRYGSVHSGTISFSKKLL